MKAAALAVALFLPFALISDSGRRGAGNPFMIHVVDEQTGRGVPW